MAPSQPHGLILSAQNSDCEIKVVKTCALTLILVSIYSLGKMVSNKSRINAGLLWAAELSATNATCRTLWNTTNHVSYDSAAAVVVVTEGIPTQDLQVSPWSRWYSYVVSDRLAEADLRLYTWMPLPQYLVRKQMVTWDFPSQHILLKGESTLTSSNERWYIPVAVATMFGVPRVLIYRHTQRQHYEYLPQVIQSVETTLTWLCNNHIWY